MSSLHSKKLILHKISTGQQKQLSLWTKLRLGATISYAASIVLITAQPAVAANVITGTVFEDFGASGNGNNTPDTGENTLGDITLTLYKDNGDGLFNATTDTQVTTTSSNSTDGTYSLGVSSDGKYFVVLDHLDSDAPSRSTALPDRTVREVDVAGANVTDQHFPYDTLKIDYGDAPSSYGDASHTYPETPTVYLGSNIDDESATQLGGDAGATASGDDTDGTDDDDGVTFSPSLGFPNDVHVVQAGATNTIEVEAAAAGNLSAWIDYNQDGDFDDAGEQIFTDTALSAGTNSLTFNPDGKILHGSTYARFRFSSQTGLSPTGSATDGEVEDYAVNVAAPVSQVNACAVTGLLNGGFEQPDIGVTGGFVRSFGSPPTASRQYHEYDVLGWNFIGTRNPPLDDIEIWQSRHGGGSAPFDAYEGGQHAEINAEESGLIFQDVVTTPGATMGWQFAHRGRAGNDIMRLRIGPAGGATVVQGTYTTGNNPNDPNQGWIVYSGTYTVPTNQHVTRFEFEAVSTANGNVTTGNFVDDVKFALPPCIPALAKIDYGDAPSSYGDASHTYAQTPTVYLGSNIDDESGTQLGGDAGATASGDDTDGTDDDDGISSFPSLVEGETSYNIPAANISATGTGTLHAWIDFDKNGTFESSEYISVAVSSGTPAGDLDWTGITVGAIGDTYARFRFTSDTNINANTPSGAGSDGEVEDYQIEIIPGYEISPAAGNIIINEVLYNETGNSAATNDEFIEIFNASTSPVDISGWQLMDGNILANDTDNTGSITGNSSPYLFPNGTILQPGEYAVIWIGDNTPDHQATAATFQAWLEKSPKLNNSGDDVWLYDKDGKIVDYIAYGSGTAINTPLPTSLNQWDDTHQTALAGASDGQSISLTKNGLDGNTSTCWEPTTSGNANTQGCTNFLPTKDTDDVGSRINSAGENNNGTPSVLLVKRITALNNQPYTNIVDGVDTGNSTSTNYVPAPKDTDDNHSNWLSSFLQGEINNIKVKPDDEIEYTIYFLSTGSTAAKNVLVCDRIPENTTFIPNIFNNETPNSDGLSGSDRGILWNYNGNTEALTNIQDGDAAQYFPPGVDPTTVYPDANCSGVNDNGAVVVNLGNLPNSTAPGTPNTSYGYIRFRGRVK